jgi:magnesium chelatase family protein
MGAALRGVEAVPVRVEVDLTSGLPSFHIVGLAGSAVRESRVRVKAALENAGYDLFAGRRATANLAPADLPKEGTGYDLPLALALLEAGGVLPAGATAGRLFAGELSLGGALKAIRGALPMADAARAHRLGLVVPEGNAAEAAVVPGLEVRAARSLPEVVEFLRGAGDLARPGPQAFAAMPPAGPDLSEVRGQERAKRALEIAAAGQHNLLLVGPPGAGKTMLARRLPTLLPPLSLDEAVETTRIHSVAGLTRGAGLVRARPFRAPHHSASDAALVGGGKGPRPGEVSLAHNGVLFLDELPEFRRSALEALRQPLEDRMVTVARARETVVFPASFQLVAAMNPCPCGMGGPECGCSAPDLQRYRARLSAPLLDRIDLMVDVPRVAVATLASAPPGESSAAVRMRVERARDVQRRRFEGRGIRSNAEMGAREIADFAQVDAEGRALLKAVGERLRLSARVYGRVLRVARTIADLGGEERVLRAHLGEALMYRCLDRMP